MRAVDLFNAQGYRNRHPRRPGSPFRAVDAFGATLMDRRSSLIVAQRAHGQGLV